MSGYRVTYPGIKIISADMVHVHGVSPSVCICKAILELKQFVESGPLQFEQDDAIVMVFEDCVVSEAYAEPACAHGVLHSEVKILDRRWKWKFKQVSGIYNTGIANGDPEYDKTWRELFEIVLLALGEAEGSYDIDIPDSLTNGPRINWDEYRADLALAELAELVGCIVALKQDNSISIEPLGRPNTQNMEEGLVAPETNYYSRETPSKVLVKFGPTMYQWFLECEMVVTDIDGQIVPLDKAQWVWNWVALFDDYAPGFITNHLAGTGMVRHPNDLVGQEGRMFRAYRPTNVFNQGVGWLPDGNSFTSHRDLSVKRHLLGHPKYGVTTDNMYGANESLLYETFPFARVNSVHAQRADEGSPANIVRETQDIEIDNITNVIMLPQRAFKVGGTLRYSPADVQAFVAWTARADASSHEHRYVYERDTSDTNSLQGTLVIDASWLSCYYIRNPSITYWNAYVPWLTNKAYLESEVGPRLADAQGYKWQGKLKTSRNKWYGVRRYEVTGAIWYVRWFVSGTKAFTEAGKNIENTFLGPTHRQRRILQEQWDA